MIIAGDIGGTKTNLAIFEDHGDDYTPTHLMTYPSQNYSDLQTIVKKFLDSCNVNRSELHTACFAIAGPVVNGICKTTNLPWIVNSKELATICGFTHVYLLNDLEANAWAIDILPAENLYELYPGKGRKLGNRAVISPGTGLGEAGIYWDGNEHHPFACEGGHGDFGPRNELQLELCRYLFNKFGHASYERILSGPGLVNVYEFFKEVKGTEEPKWLTEELNKSDPAKVITQYALNEKAPICVAALDLFVSILGSEASNCALKFMAFGGVYLGGGIPPKILPRLKDPIFLNAFVDKGRFKELLEAIPIEVILDDKASLKGSAYYCRKANIKTFQV